MGIVWEYQWEYTDLDNGQVKLYPFWLTKSEGLRSDTLIEGWGRCLDHTRRERVGPPEWREAQKVKPSGVRPLPEFEPPTRDELANLYRSERDHDVKRVILEVVRARRVMAEIERLVAIVRNEYGDGLVATNLLRCLVQDERWRVGEFGDHSAGSKPDR